MCTCIYVCVFSDVGIDLGIGLGIESHIGIEVDMDMYGQKHVCTYIYTTYIHVHLVYIYIPGIVFLSTCIHALMLPSACGYALLLHTSFPSLFSLSLLISSCLLQPALSLAAYPSFCVLIYD